MKGLYKIRCAYCFAHFNPHEVLFKCVWEHRPAFIFDPRKDRSFGKKKDYFRAACPRDHIWSSLRVCPNCKKSLPRYAGRIARRSMVATVGIPGSGKTVFLISLIMYLMDRSGSTYPNLVPMFENDESFEAFKPLFQRMIVDRELPYATRLNPAVEPPPISIRLYGASSNDRKGENYPPNLVFFDSPGEVVVSFNNASLVRYLAHASSLILTLDANLLREVGDGASRSFIGNEDPSEVVEVMTRRIRDEMNLPAVEKLKKRLAVVFTKCDAWLYRNYPHLKPPVDSDGSLANGDERKNYLNRTNQICQKLLEGWQQSHFLSLVQKEFSAVRFFTCSALGQAPGPKLARPEPIGVAEPLLWALGVS